MQFAARCMDCLLELALKHADENILIATHGGVISTLAKYVLKQHQDSTRPYRTQNTAINVFAYEGGNWFVESWGDIHHLEDITTTSSQSDI